MGRFSRELGFHGNLVARGSIPRTDTVLTIVFDDGQLYSTNREIVSAVNHDVSHNLILSNN